MDSWALEGGGPGGLDSWLLPLKGLSLVVGRPECLSPRSRAREHLHESPDRRPFSPPLHLPSFLQRAIQQAVGTSLQGDLANDKGMMGSSSSSALCPISAFFIPTSFTGFSEISWVPPLGWQRS